MSTNKKGFNLFSKVFLRDFTAVMVGMFFFGFIDNFILVIAGEAIDQTIAQSMGFSSMFSAGLGNTISDFVGIIGGSVMALVVVKMFGEVDEDKYSQTMLITSQSIGIVLGCLAGLIPLAFMS
jgi:hypothetical protein